MRNWNYSLVCENSESVPQAREQADSDLTYLVDQKNGDGMIKQLLNLVIAKYRDLSVASRSIVCLSIRLRQIIDLLRLYILFSQHKSCASTQEVRSFVLFIKKSSCRHIHACMRSFYWAKQRTNPPEYLYHMICIGKTKCSSEKGLSICSPLTNQDILLNLAQ